MERARKGNPHLLLVLLATAFAVAAIWAATALAAAARRPLPATRVAASRRWSSCRRTTRPRRRTTVPTTQTDRAAARAARPDRAARTRRTSSPSLRGSPGGRSAIARLPRRSGLTLGAGLVMVRRCLARSFRSSSLSLSSERRRTSAPAPSGPHPRMRLRTRCRHQRPHPERPTTTGQHVPGSCLGDLMRQGERATSGLLPEDPGASDGEDQRRPEGVRVQGPRRARHRDEEPAPRRQLHPAAAGDHVRLGACRRHRRLGSA